MPPADDEIKTPVTDPVTDEPTGTEPEPEGLSDAGKAALKAERQKARDAEKALKAHQAELDALRKEKADAAAAKAQADEEEARRKGEFEQIATKRSEELKTATGERDTYKAQLDALVTAIKPEVDARWKGLPDEVTELYEGGDDDILAKRAHIAKHQKLIDRLGEQDDAAKDRHRTPMTPRPNPNAQNGLDTDARREQSSIYKSTF
jgi:chromosome segregation ATPase